MFRECTTEEILQIIEEADQKLKGGQYIKMNLVKKVGDKKW